MSGECEKCGEHCLECRCDDDTQIIFRLNRNDYDYKGILFADVDFQSLEYLKIPLPPKDFIAGVTGVVWTDERGCWYAKMRIKFPSGAKLIKSYDFEEEFKEKKNINETYVLNEVYKLPMINKIWRKNPDGSPEGILKIIEELGMIESIRFVKNDN